MVQVSEGANCYCSRVSPILRAVILAVIVSAALEHVHVIWIPAVIILTLIEASR